MKKIILLTLCGTISCFGIEDKQNQQIRFLTTSVGVSRKDVELLISPEDTFLPFTREEFGAFLEKFKRDLAAIKETDTKTVFGARFLIISRTRAEIKRKRAELWRNFTAHASDARESYPAGHAIERVIDFK